MRQKMLLKLIKLYLTLNSKERGALLLALKILS